MSVRAVMLLAALLAHQLHPATAEVKLLNFVVALVTDVHCCYGTLISANWILTAADCFEATSVQYGDLTIPLNATTNIRKILFYERPRSTKILEPDLGLVFISSVPLGHFALLSAVDYKAMAGHAIKYTDFLASQNDVLKEGVVTSCNGNKNTVLASLLCVAPKCSDKQQLALPGMPGSPLFHDGKLVGVHVGDSTYNFFQDKKLYVLRTYTPISPFLTWINAVINTKEFATFR